MLLLRTCSPFSGDHKPVLLDFSTKDVSPMDIKSVLGR